MAAITAATTDTPSIIRSADRFGAWVKEIAVDLPIRKDIGDVIHGSHAEILARVSAANSDEEARAVEIFARRIFLFLVFQQIDIGEHAEHGREDTHANGAYDTFDSIGQSRGRDKIEHKQCDGNSLHDKMPPSICPGFSPRCWLEPPSVFTDRVTESVNGYEAATLGVGTR
jgi:hypothetical protein